MQNSSAGGERLAARQAYDGSRAKPKAVCTSAICEARLGEGEKLERRGKSWQQGRPSAAASQSREQFAQAHLVLSKGTGRQGRDSSDRACGGQRRCAEPAHGLWGLFILGCPFPEHASAAARRDPLQRPAVEGPGNSSGSKEGPRGSNRYGCSTFQAGQPALSQNGYGIVLAGLENRTCLGRQPFKPGLRENRLHSECLARSTQFTQP